MLETCQALFFLKCAGITGYTRFPTVEADKDIRIIDLCHGSMLHARVVDVTFGKDWDIDDQIAWLEVGWIVHCVHNIMIQF